MPSEEESYDVYPRLKGCLGVVVFGLVVTYTASVVLLSFVQWGQTMWRAL